jgi:enamine deaminase RidA (YjgF/YER057c/UK114 family)
MLKKVVRWLDREFVELSCEGDGRGSAADEAHALFLLMSNELRHFGLSLDHVIRTRLWGRDRATRDAGSDVRFATLSGAARAASSSYIAPQRFDSPNGRVALDLVALKTPAPPAKTIRENDPPRMPIRYMTIGDLVILSGMTNQQPTLNAQLADIMPRVGAALQEAGSGWNKVALMSGYLHRSQDPEALKAGIAKWTGGVLPARLEIGFADGYSAPDKLIEIETTATR